MNQIVLGLWPIAGITSSGVTQPDSLATIQEAIDLGINTFDTAYSYGFDGESDRMLGEVLRRSENRGRGLAVIGKVGQRLTEDRQRVVDGSPEQLTADAELSLQRMQIEQFDLLMLHAVDPNVDVKRSGAAIELLRQRGLAKRIGICCTSAADLLNFAQECPCSAIQCPLNLFQQETIEPLIKTAAAIGAESHVYWTLMKGLLAGKISRNHVFDVGDSRPKYKVFQGAQRQRAHDVIDKLALLAIQHRTTVARLSIGWALSQPGVTAALVGAKRAEQIRETASATALDPVVLESVNRAMLP